MKKNLFEKVSALAYAILGLINLLSFVFVPFYGPVELGEAPTPLSFLMMVFSNQHIFDLDTLLPTCLFVLFLFLSLFMMVYGFIRFFQIGKRQTKYLLTSNRNPFFGLSLVLFTLSLFSLLGFNVNAYFNNLLLDYIPSFFTWKVGFGVFAIFPLNAVVSLLYIILVTRLAKRASSL